METNKIVQMVQNKKKVFVVVPIEKDDDPIIERAIQVARRDYCRVKNCKPTDVEWMDYLRDIKKITTDIEMNLIKNTKHEHLIWTADELALIATDVDEVIFGANWLVSKSCKSIARTCELFMIPQIRMMRGEKKVEIEESKDVQEYRKKHHITVVWKE